MRNELSEQIHGLADLVHRPARKSKDALQHYRHDREKAQHAPDTMGQDAVELVTESIPCPARLGSPTERRALGKWAFQANSRRCDCCPDGLRIMPSAGDHEPLVAQDELRFRDGFKVRFRKSLFEQTGQGFDLLFKLRRKFAEKLWPIPH